MRNLLIAAALGLIAATQAKAENMEKVRLITLDPGHFHAALVQKSMYPNVDPVVHVYAPDGPELKAHLARITGFNSRADKPTDWQEKVYTGPDFLEKMLAEKPGNVVVISGKNARKADYILACVRAGLNVLSDKPMAITPADFRTLEKAFIEARRNNVLLCDIMTERHEITTILQRDLSMLPAIFGELETGSPDNPAITKESVHHYFKTVAGVPLVRPPWFFDVTQQGEGIVDVTTHLVDLVQWECFPGQSLHPGEVEMIDARHWTTTITPDQFTRATGLTADKPLAPYCNGEMLYTLRGIHAKVSVEWRFEAPAGAGDTHYSMMRGAKANLVIRQGKEQNYKPTLYVEKRTRIADKEFEHLLKSAVAELNNHWPGVGYKKAATGWEITIPDKYKLGHEAHFAQVTERYLQSLKTGKLPDWEVPNMITKYSTLMQAYKLSR